MLEKYACGIRGSQLPVTYICIPMRGPGWSGRGSGWWHGEGLGHECVWGGGEGGIGEGRDGGVREEGREEERNKGN